MTIAAFLTLLVLSNYLLGTFAVIAILLAVAMFVTALFGYCPFYSLFNISTQKNK